MPGWCSCIIALLLSHHELKKFCSWLHIVEMEATLLQATRPPRYHGIDGGWFWDVFANVTVPGYLLFFGFTRPLSRGYLILPITKHVQYLYQYTYWSEDCTSWAPLKVLTLYPPSADFKKQAFLHFWRQGCCWHTSKTSYHYEALVLVGLLIFLRTIVADTPANTTVKQRNQQFKFIMHISAEPKWNSIA